MDRGSPMDGIEVIAGHVLSPQPLMVIQKQRHLHRQQPKDSIAGLNGAEDNALPRRSGSLVKRLDAKKSMAEISIPVSL